MTQLKRALISCTNKTGITRLASVLAEKGVEILSTGGTAKILRENGVRVTEVSDYTGSPEILDGRLKTLHPKIHGGILAIRDNPNHEAQMSENNIAPIDLIVVNLYEFEKTVALEGCTLESAIENIDIGGPTMLRSAAKNYRDVAVVVDPADYPELIRYIEEGTIPEEFRFRLAVKVFEKTSQYDTAIFNYLSHHGENKNPNGFKSSLSVQLEKIQDLRYGENPHQRAAIYREQGVTAGIVNAKQWQGKELSFNNILDLESAYNCCREFTDPACVIVKHLNPCGVAIDKDMAEAFIKAREGDPVSCFGGIVACNKRLTRQTAVLIAESFFEAVIAPEYEEEALAIFQQKKNLRVMSLDNFSTNAAYLDYRRVGGGMLVQDFDNKITDISQGKTVTKRSPTDQEIHDLNFAWRVVKHVKSNAIVFAKDRQSVGMGAGQMSRVDSVKIAVMKAHENFKDTHILTGAIMASDAFFPFRDGVDAAAKAGITAIVQPGGSMRDQEVIAACDEHGIAMVFTGMRHFRH